MLIRGEVSSPQANGVTSDYTTTGTKGYFKLESRPFLNFPGWSGWRWRFSFSDQIPLTVNLSMGAGDMALDFSDLDLLGLNVSQGVGNMSLKIAENGSYNVDVSQAIGFINIILPEAAGVQIEVGKAISALSLPAGFQKRGDFYYSANYDSVDKRIELDISQAIGNIRVSY
jgi:hypothetical protein